MGAILSLLDNSCERNPLSGNYSIKVSPNPYADIFYEPDLLCFLDDSIDDIPRKENIDFSFYLFAQEQNEEWDHTPLCRKDIDKEQTINSWFCTYCKLCIELEKTNQF